MHGKQRNPESHDIALIHLYIKFLSWQPNSSGSRTPHIPSRSVVTTSAQASARMPVISAPSHLRPVISTPTQPDNVPIAAYARAMTGDPHLTNAVTGYITTSVHGSWPSLHGVVYEMNDTPVESNNEHCFK